MPDEVIPEGDALSEGETMFVHERIVILADGTSVHLRRFYYPAADGARRMLDDGAWCAVRGGVDRMFAVPAGVRGGAEWLFGQVFAYPTWQDALEAARSAESRYRVAA